MMFSRLSKQSGVALITVLLIVSLVTVLATDMAVRLQMQIQRTDNLASNEQAYWYAMGAESYVKLILAEAVKEKDGMINLDQAWAIQNMVFPIEDGQISGQIKDLHACFNVNALYKKVVTNSTQTVSEERSGQDEDDDRNVVSNNPNAENKSNVDKFDIEVKQQFMALLEALNIENYEAEQIRDGLVDWLDPDSIAGTYGAEDYVYEAKANPYITANSPMVDESELRLIQGVSSKILEKISPYLCIIPDNVDMVLNVNTITAENAEILHAMLAPKLSLSAAKAVISGRPKEGFKDINDFWQSAELTAFTNIAPRVKAQFSVASKHFKMITKTEFNRSWIDLKTSFEVDKDGKVQVIAREFGV